MKGEKGETHENYLQISSLLPFLLFLPFLNLLEEEWELLNVAYSGDIHNDDTVDQRKVLPEQDKGIIMEGIMGERMGSIPSSVPLSCNESFRRGNQYDLSEYLELFKQLGYKPSCSFGGRSGNMTLKTDVSSWLV